MSNAYTRTRNESELVQVLSEALSRAGYIVRGEVHCTLPFDLGHGEPVQRRVDLWAMRKPMVIPGSPIWPDGDGWRVGEGGVIAIEVKWVDGGGSKLWRCGIQQAKAAMRAHDWFGERAGMRHPIQRPSVALVCDQWTLGGVQQFDGVDPCAWDGGDLWANGVGVLRGSVWGLSFQAHVGRQNRTVRVTP